MDVFDFIKIYNNRKPLAQKGVSLTDLSKNLGKTFRNINEVVDYCRDKIKSLLQTTDNTGLKKNMLSDAVRSLLVLKECKGIDTQSVIDGFDELLFFLDSGNSLFIKQYDEKMWGEVVSFLKTIQIIKPDQGYSLYDRWQKEKVFSKSLKRLQNEGLTWKISGMDIVEITNPELVAKQILDSVRKIGGREFVQCMLNELVYCVEAHRFLLNRQGYNPAMPNWTISTPTNYMLNLGMRCIKYPTKIKPADLQAEYNRVKQICTDFCFVTNPVLSDNIWSDIIPSVDSLEYLKRMFLRDSVFGLNQTNSDFVADFTFFIVTELQKMQGYDKELLACYVETMKWFLSKADEKQFKAVKKKSFRLRGTRTIFSSVFKSIEIKENKVNDGFLLPADYLKFNLLDKPVISCKDYWLIPPKSIMGFSWYEAILSNLRSTNKTVDNEVGTIMERFIQHKFSSIGMSIYSGEYSYNTPSGKKTGECDHLIKTSKSIVLIEDKRKAVTRDAKSGNPDNILQDLMFSLVASQYQCLRTSSCLLNDGKVELRKGKDITVVECNQQNFDHISLDLFDFGPISSRVFIDRILEKILRSKYAIKDNAVLSKTERDVAEKNIEKCNKLVEGLQKAVEIHYHNHRQAEIKRINEKFGDPVPQNKESEKEKALQNIDKSFRPFFNSWFMSLEQLVFLINQSSDSDSFMKNLHSIKCVTTCTGEFYNEWAIMKQFNKNEPVPRTQSLRLNAKMDS